MVPSTNNERSCHAAHRVSAGHDARSMPHRRSGGKCIESPSVTRRRHDRGEKPPGRTLPRAPKNALFEGRAKAFWNHERSKFKKPSEKRQGRHDKNIRAQQDRDRAMIQGSKTPDQWRIGSAAKKYRRWHLSNESQLTVPRGALPVFVSTSGTNIWS